MCNRAGAGFMDILTVFVMVVTTGMTIMSGAVSGVGLDMMAVGEIIAAGIDHRVQRLDGLDAVCHRVRRVTSAEFSVGMTTRWRDQRAMFAAAFERAQLVQATSTSRSRPWGDWAQSQRYAFCVAPLG